MRFKAVAAICSRTYFPGSPRACTIAKYVVWITPESATTTNTAVQDAGNFVNDSRTLLVGRITKNKNPDRINARRILVLTSR